MKQIFDVIMFLCCCFAVIGGLSEGYDNFTNPNPAYPTDQLSGLTLLVSISAVLLGVLISNKNDWPAKATWTMVLSVGLFALVGFTDMTRVAMYWTTIASALTFFLATVLSRIPPRRPIYTTGVIRVWIFRLR